MSETRHNPEELSRYLAERLERKVESPTKIKELKTQDDIKGAAEELADLTLEQQDVLAAIAGDEKLVAAKVAAGEEQAIHKLLEKEELSTKDHADLHKLSEARRNKIAKAMEIPSDAEQMKLVESGDFDALLKIERDDLATAPTLKRNRAEAQNLAESVKKLAGDERVREAYEKLLKEKIETISFARKVEKARVLLDRLDYRVNNINVRRNEESLSLTAGDKKELAVIAKRRRAVEQKINEMLAVPEVYLEVDRRERVDYGRALRRGELVETPSVKEKINEIRAHFDRGVPVFLWGHLGAGKTELLRHISRKYYAQEPEIFSGSEEASAHNIIGKMKLEARGAGEEYYSQAAEALAKSPLLHGLNKADIVSMLKVMGPKVVESVFQVGPLIKAIDGDKMFIFDEMDEIPREILTRFNDILILREGKVVEVPEDSNRRHPIGPGFKVGGTGNIKSKKYIRKELDAAQLSRWWSTEIQYLPENEMGQLILAMLSDRRGNVELSAATNLESIKQLAKAAAEIQAIFADRKIDVHGIGGDPAKGIGGTLEKSVLSLRDLKNIVEAWKAGGFEAAAGPRLSAEAKKDDSLNWYIYEEFIQKSTVPKDRVYLTQLFCRFGFFKKWKAKDFGFAELNDAKLAAFKE